MATWVPLINICLTVCVSAAASEGNVIRPPCYKAGIGQANNLSLCILDEMAVFPDGKGRHKEKRQASVAVKFQRCSLPAEQQMRQVILLPSKERYHFFQTIKFMESEMVWLSLAPVNFIVICGQICLCLILICSLSFYYSEKIWRH